MANQSTWQERVTQLEKEREEKDLIIKDLQEQLQDFMIHMDTLEKFKNTEAEGGDLVTRAAPTSSRQGNKGRARSKKI